MNNRKVDTWKAYPEKGKAADQGRQRLKKISSAEHLHNSQNDSDCQGNIMKGDRNMNSVTQNRKSNTVECLINCTGIIVPYSESRAIEIPIMMKDRDGKVHARGHYLRVNKTGSIQTVKR